MRESQLAASPFHGAPWAVWRARTEVSSKQETLKLLVEEELKQKWRSVLQGAEEWEEQRSNQSYITWHLVSFLTESGGISNGGAEYLDEHERGVKEICHFVRQELEH